MKCIACGNDKMNIDDLCLDCKIILDLMNIKYFNNSYAKCRLCNYPLNNPEVSTYCEICINKYHINIVPLNQHKHDIRLKSRVG